MKLHQPYTLLRPGKALCKCPSYERLAGPGRPLKDHLPLVEKQCVSLAQELRRQPQPLRKRHQIRRLRCRWLTRSVTVRVSSVCLGWR